MRDSTYQAFATSTDSGETWSLVSGYSTSRRDLAIHAHLTMHPARPDILYAGTSNGIFALGSKPYLEVPRRGMAIDAENNPIRTGTAFSGGVSVNGGRFPREASVSGGDPFVVHGLIETDKDDIYEVADIIAAVIYTPPFPLNNAAPQMFMFDGENAVVPWDMNSFSVSSLPAFQRDVFLYPYHVVKLFEGKFNGAGRLEFYFGYRLNGETLVYNGTRPVDIQIIR
ncbi:MAG: hypothetical protein GY862_19280 [Gammaproteobacteria bacterium]|nr:hypothetical protein [Gammaproteobacteria bacterium]